MLMFMEGNTCRVEWSDPRSHRGRRTEHAHTGLPRNLGDLFVFSADEQPRWSSGDPDQAGWRSLGAAIWNEAMPRTEEPEAEATRPRG